MAKNANERETAQGFHDRELSDLDLEGIAGGAGAKGRALLQSPITTPSGSRLLGPRTGTSGSSGPGGRATTRSSLYATGPARRSLNSAAASRTGIR